jgi:hypothetical protein
LRPNTLMQLSRSSVRHHHLATHGRTIHNGTSQKYAELLQRRDKRTFIWVAQRFTLLRLVGCLPRRNGAAARAAGVRQASKEETAAHHAGAADVMGIVASASGAEQPSLTRSGVGELAVRATAGAADDTLGVPTARMRMHRGHHSGRSGERRCAGCSTLYQQHEGHGRAGERS